MKNSRKGFTLVELLIVIVVIGVLSTMMMLSSTEAVSSAKASNIVSNLRNLKTAALAWYVDNLSTADTVNISSKRTEIIQYMSNESVASEYKFTGKGEGNWYVYYESPESRVGDKLKSRKDDVGLKKITAGNTPTVANYDGGTNIVGMFIR